MAEKNVRTIVVNRSAYADNDLEASLLRNKLKEEGVYLVNMMSSPGSGKTTTLVRLINLLKDKYRIGVMEADIDSDIDALKVSEVTGVKSIQLHTSGMCHLDAGMTFDGLKAIDYKDLDLIFLENVGNLVCPAEFDAGAHLDITILSVPEGDDKPLKYPLIYQKCNLVIINKMDTLPYFTFSLEKCKENIRMRNENATIIPISAKTGEGSDKLVDYFIKSIQEFREEK